MHKEYRKCTPLYIILVRDQFELYFNLILTNRGMPCTPAVPHWVWEPSTREAVRKTISIGVHLHINNLSIYHAERKPLNRLHVYRYKMVEIHMLPCWTVYLNNCQVWSKVEYSALHKIIAIHKKNILNIKFLVLFAYTCIYITGDLCNSAA